MSLKYSIWDRVPVPTSTVLPGIKDAPRGYQLCVPTQVIPVSVRIVAESVGSQDYGYGGLEHLTL